ncbi:MAG: primosomal protein N' [Actinomycetota bacterium]|nr:primosomal protein N' [Actinomycetota bacterium]
MIARVRPLTRTRAVKGLFDYRLAADQAEVRVGSLLRVPFGRRRELAVVVELATRSELEPERLAQPDAVLATGIPADLVALAEWMAREYCSTPARALGLVLAPGVAEGMRSKRVLVAGLTDAGRAALGGAAKLTDNQLATLQTLARDGPTVAARLGTPGLRRLEGRGLVTLRGATQRRRPARHRVGTASGSPPRLTGEQQVAMDTVLGALAAPPDRRECGHFLLHGVTGSGKTEVYLRAVEATLAAGRGAIVLVPEIALTPQALSRFEARFGDVVAVIHSGLGQGERFDEWLRVARGEARVCVGPRSAVFAPMPEIGLIVVDEEHESSYKHEGDPRYDARAVAERRAAEHGAVLLLGSATPRPESMLGVRRLRLRERVDGRPLPPVEILDMRGQHHPLHPDTRAALSNLKRAGGKAIVLLNRRGWSNFLSCRSCGQVWMCPNCEVALVLHRRSGFVACHHCGHHERVPSRCVACASVSVARHGAGTERIEHELVAAFGDESFPVLRLDADAPGVDERARALQRFHDAPSAVLVGTQMVAKGHDFPDVGLGIVLDADQTLRFPDFRAEERTFSLVTQLAGRTGRGGGRDGRIDGRVLVQTLAPEARSIRLAARHDAETFLAGELERRRALAYPPFATLIRVICSAAAAEAGDAGALAAALGERIDPPGAMVLGPAPLFALRGRARTQLVLKATDRGAAIAAVGAAVDALAGSAVGRGASVSVDVDPQ